MTHLHKTSCKSENSVSSSGVARVGVTRGGNRRPKNYPSKFSNDLFLNFLNKYSIYPGKIFNDFLAFHMIKCVYPKKFPNDLFTFPNRKVYIAPKCF